MSRGRKRKVSHEDIVTFALAHPETFQSEIARLFGTSQCRVSKILRTAGIVGIQRGRAPKRKSNQTEEAFEWEQILHNHGLGMNRGQRINNMMILYGIDYTRSSSE